MVRRLSKNNSKKIAAQLWDSSAQGCLEKGEVSGLEIIRRQKAQAESIQDQQIKEELENITLEISENIKDTILSDLPKEVGGTYNAKQEVRLNKNLLEFSLKKPGQSIQDSIQETQDRIKHVFQHENQHKEHNDHLPLSILEDGLLLGGIQLSPTELIEGANIALTGTHTQNNEKVVSLEYMRIHKKFQRALSNSKHNLGSIQNALKSRDVISMDDRFNPTQIAI